MTAEGMYINLYLFYQNVIVFGYFIFFSSGTYYCQLGMACVYMCGLPCFFFLYVVFGIILNVF